MAQPLRPAQHVALACAGAVAALATTVLAGWGLGLDPLQRAFMAGGVLLPDAALGLLLGAVALALRTVGGSHRPTRIASAAAAGATLSIGLAQATDDLVNLVWPLAGFHLNLLPEPPYQLPPSPLGTLALLLAGSALLAAARGGRRARLAAEALAFLLLFTALPGLTGYFYGAPELMLIRGFDAVPAPGLVGYLLLGAAIPIALESRNGLLRLLSGATGGGMLMRRVLPAALGALLAAGWLQLRAIDAGLLTPHTAAALFGTASFTILFFLMWYAAAGINRLEADKDEIGASYRTVLDTAPGGVMVVDGAGRIVLANHRAEEMFGYGAGELPGLPVELLVPAAQRDRHQELREGFFGSPAARRTATAANHTALRARRRDGSEFVANISLGPHQSRHGPMVTAVVHDVSDLVQRETEIGRVNRALRLLSAANQAIQQASLEAELLDELCRVIVAVGGYRFAWIGYAQNDARKSVRPVAWGGAEDGFFGEATVTWDESPTGASMAGTAIRTGTAHVVHDIAAEARLAPWREALLARGCGSVAAFPLDIEGRVQGALVIYAATRDAFVPEERTLLEDLAGDIAYGIGGLRAAQSRFETEAALRRSEATLARAQEIAHIGSWEWDLATGAMRWSAESFRIFGCEPDETEPSLDLIRERTHPDDWARLEEKFGEAKRGDVTSARAEFRAVREDGTARWIHMQAEVEFHDTGPYRVVGALQDISERRRFEERLAQLASFDGLTGLPNRHLLNDRLEQGLAHAGHGGRMLALVFVDLDRFKIINDTLGHDAGDQLLKEIAGRLTDCLRPGDTVARQGGDEFVVLLADLAKPEDAGFVAQKMLESLAPPCEIFGHEVVPAASLGVALYPRDGTTIQELMSNADKAMYAAKQAGRGQYRFFDVEMNRAAADWLEVGALLHHALERDQFELHYQPKVDLRSGAVTGVEALLRWRCPELGLVSPDRFIPILEDTGRILEVGEWVLAEACRQASQWQEQGLPPLRIAVNLSPRQFQQRDLAARMSAIIEQEGILPGFIELEITESMVAQNVERAIAALRELHDLGVRLAIDDFGTGYSSLAALKGFPVDCLKIDRSFVRDVPHDPDDVAITRAVVLLAHSMGLSVVAEGVETEAQRDFLIECGCDEMQGYLFSRPLPAAQLGELLRETSVLAA